MEFNNKDIANPLKYGSLLREIQLTDGLQLVKYREMPLPSRESDDAMSMRRIITELQRDAADKERLISMSIVDDNMFNILASFEGPLSTPYEGGIFQVLIKLDNSYPMNPPKCRFITKVYHPNINTSGDVCVSFLGQGWIPVLGIRTILLSLLSLLCEPNADDCLEPEIGRVYSRSKEQYELMARSFTHSYATMDDALAVQAAVSMDPNQYFADYTFKSFGNF